MPHNSEPASEQYLLDKLAYLASLSQTKDGLKPFNRLPVLSLHSAGPANAEPEPVSVTGLDSQRRTNRRAIRRPSEQANRRSKRRKAEPPEINDSAVGAAEVIDISQTAGHQIEINGVEIWLSGSSLLCRCPSCKAPLTIQTWLGLADCWQCQTSIALTEEQLAAAQSLPATPRSAPASAPSWSSPLIDRGLSDSNALPLPVRVDPETELDPRERELERLARGSRLVRAVRRGMHLTPAWLISMLVHLILILILALIVFREGSELAERITLSTFLSSEKELGGKFQAINPDFQIQDDLEMASQLLEGDEELRNVIQKANEDAAELRQDPNPRVPLPNLEQVRENLTTQPDKLMSFAARDPRVRAEIVAREGGTSLTEAAVARALRWLVSVQNQDGSWSLANYDRHDNPKNKGDVMGTSLALLPLLGAGQTHEYGIYKDAVGAGLAWLIESQLANGDLRAGITEDAGMYAHGQASIVLCEALALTGDERFRKPAQLAIQFIEEAQHREGGWRYQPGQPGDTSVFGWQMMALQSARSPSLNLKVNEDTLRLADYFLDSVATPTRSDRNLPAGATYAYMQGREATPAMTAEAILCRMYLGWDRYDPRLSESVKWMIRKHLPSDKDRQLYYWYYATQVMHHYGGQPWKTWNARMREILISTQQTRGRHPGSWNTDLCSWGSRGGRIYTTSLACCILEVYYRHLPLFNKIELEPETSRIP